MKKKVNLFSLSIFWLAWEVQWAALLGAGLQGQIARFFPPDRIGTATAILAGSGAALSILAQYLAGKASDRVGRHIAFIVTGTLLNIVALFGFALAPSFLSALIAFAAVQIAFNVAGGPYQALMPSRVEMSARSRASAVMGLFRIGGNAVGLLLAKKFVQQPGPLVTAQTFTAGLLHLVIALSIVLLVALALTVVGVPERRADETPAMPKLAPWPARVSFAWLIASRASVSMGLYLILPFLAFYLRFAQHVPNYLAKSLDLLLVMTGCALIGTVPAGIAGDRVSKKRILFGALALLAAGAVCLSLISGTSKLLPLGVLLGLGWGAYFSVDWALACVLLPPGRAGALMAVWNIGSSAPQVAAPILGGLLVDRAGAWSGDLAFGYRLLFAVVALFVVLGAVGLSFVREPREGLARQTG